MLLRFIIVAIVFALPSIAVVQAAELFELHPHEEQLKAYEGVPELLSLTKEEDALLKSGDAVLRQSETNESGSGVAVQLVAAPASLIWDLILKYDQYKEWVKNVDDSKVYRVFGDQLFVEMDLSFWWIESKLYTINTLDRKKGYMSWVLDRSRTSDVIDLVGYWRIEQISEEPALTRVQYATEMVVGGFPDFIVSFLTRDSLTDGTAWVKERAEEEWGRRQGAFKK